MWRQKQSWPVSDQTERTVRAWREGLVSVGIHICGKRGQFPDKYQTPQRLQGRGSSMSHLLKRQVVGERKARASHFPMTDKMAFSDIVLGLSVEYEQ